MSIRPSGSASALVRPARSEGTTDVSGWLLEGNGGGNGGQGAEKGRGKGVWIGCLMVKGSKQTVGSFVFRLNCQSLHVSSSSLSSSRHPQMHSRLLVLHRKHGPVLPLLLAPLRTQYIAIQHGSGHYQEGALPHLAGPQQVSGAGDVVRCT